MTDASKLVVNGSEMPVKDAQARAKADSALELAATAQGLAAATYKGRNLAEKFATEIMDYDNEWAWLQARVRAGNFDGILPRDYLDVTLTTGNVMRYRVAAIDPYYRVGDTPMGHGLPMVPDQTVPVTGAYATNGDKIMWNATATNNGTASENSPYMASRLHAWETEVFKPTLPQAVRDAILPRRMLLEKRYSASGGLTASNGWAWYTCDIWSLSETEVFGQAAWGGGYSIADNCHFPLFATMADCIRDAGADATRYGWWLRSVNDGIAANVAIVGNDGDAYNNSAAYTGVRPLPCFLIG